MITSQGQLEKIAKIMADLDGNLAAKDEENRRRSSRVAIRMQMTFIVLGGMAPASVDIYSRNISPSGIGFVSRRMFRPDERMVIPLRLSKVPAKLVLARVTFSRYIGGGYYEMGAEFLECANDMGGKGLGRIPSRWLSGAAQVNATA